MFKFRLSSGHACCPEQFHDDVLFPLLGNGKARILKSLDQIVAILMQTVCNPSTR